MSEIIIWNVLGTISMVVIAFITIQIWVENKLLSAQVNKLLREKAVAEKLATSRRQLIDYVDRNDNPNGDEPDYRGLLDIIHRNQGKNVD